MILHGKSSHQRSAWNFINQGISPFTGNKSCDHITGEILCRTGYLGLTCEHPCPAGLYGPGCKLKCDCDHGGECNHVTGQCQCLPGWTGANCKEPCPTDTYGQGCAQQCRCLHHKVCRKNDGMCICEKGWMGTRCDEVCPEGFYGEHCMNPCACPSANFQCHAAHGCVCRSGYTGDNCDDLIASQRVADPGDDCECFGRDVGIPNSYSCLFYSQRAEPALL